MFAEGGPFQSGHGEMADGGKRPEADGHMPARPRSSGRDRVKVGGLAGMMLTLRLSCAEKSPACCKDMFPGSMNVRGSSGFAFVFGGLLDEVQAAGFL